ncbi:MAG: aspartate ammonia-lyase [Actinobacteria bacterium]|nr:aspartate ammonia-lyase [Actinomycetota bacterium]
MAARIEKDPLGPLAVPADALYGVQTQRAVQNFPISGIKPHPAYVWGTVLIKKAAALTHVQTGRLERRLADAIVKAADEVLLEGRHADQFVVDVFQAGAGTSHNMNANELLANRANELLGGTRGDYKPVHPNDHVNMAQSTNDLIPTAIALAALKLLPALYGALDLLAGELEAKARAWDSLVKSGRTHLQDATPVRLGQEFGAYALAVRRDLEHIRRAEEAVQELSLGGTAVGTGLNAEPAYQAKVIEVIAQLTGFPVRRASNLFYAMQSMTRFAVLSGALRALAVDLGRIANDFRLLGSGPRTGLSELRMPPVQPGSSIMPGKVNPVMAECLNMICFQVFGNDLTIAWAAEAGQLELNVMMPIIAYNLCQSLEILANGARAFAEFGVRGLVADEAMIKFWLDRNTMLATALAPKIGYAAAAEIAKETVATGESIPQVAKRKTGLPDDELNRALDPAPMTEPGVRAGGGGG